MPVHVCNTIGKIITPIRSMDNVGHPLIGYVVETPRGFFAIPNGEAYEGEFRDDISSAIDYIRRAH